MNKISTTIVAILIVVGGSFIVAKSGFFNITSPGTVFSTSPKGKIYLTLSQVGSRGESKAGIYELDLSSRNITPTLVDQSDNLMIKYSNDGEKVAFVSDRESTGDHGSPALYIADKNLANIRRVTPENLELQKNPVFSPDGKTLAYWTSIGNVLSGTEAWNPSNYGIYTTDLEGNFRTFDTGAFPIFSPDGRGIIALKEKGIYLIRLEDKFPERKIRAGTEVLHSITLPETFSTNMRLNVSKNGDYLALTHYEEGRIYVFRIYSWEPFQARTAHVFNGTPAYWPIFSPDSRYLAIQRADYNPVEPNPRIEIYDLSNFEKVFEYDLSGFDQSKMWVTDWR